MSFKREGDDYSALNNIKKRRVEELLSNDIPEDEACLLKSGRFACLVCSSHPVLDTVDMLSVHRNGKKHKACAEHFFRKKREFHQLVEKRRQEEATIHGKQMLEAIQESPLLLATRKATQNALLRYAPYNPVSSGAQRGRKEREDFKTNRSENKGFFQYTRNFLTNNVPRKEEVPLVDSPSQHEDSPTARVEDNSTSIIVAREHKHTNNEATSLEDVPLIDRNRSSVSVSSSQSCSGVNDMMVKPYVSKRQKCVANLPHKQTSNDCRNTVAQPPCRDSPSSQGHVKVKPYISKRQRLRANSSSKLSSNTRHEREDTFIQSRIIEASDCELITTFPPHKNNWEERISNSGESHRRVAADLSSHPSSNTRNERGSGLNQIPDVEASEFGPITGFETHRTYDTGNGLGSRKAECTCDADNEQQYETGGHCKNRMRELEWNKSHRTPDAGNRLVSPYEARKVQTEEKTSTTNGQTRGERKSDKPLSTFERKGPPVKFTVADTRLGKAPKRGKETSRNTGMVLEGQSIMITSSGQGSMVSETAESVQKKSVEEKGGQNQPETKMDKYSEQRKQELKRHLELTSSGWVHDPSGKWVKGEDVEFDSDEEEPV